jgi:hypothetical protein
MESPNAIAFLRNFHCILLSSEGHEITIQWRASKSSLAMIAKLAQAAVSIKTPFIWQDYCSEHALQMKSIMVTYPGFQCLPKGLKQMLVESESFFFEEETTFIRRDGKPPSALLKSIHRLAVGGQVSQSWNN